GTLDDFTHTGLRSSSSPTIRQLLSRAPVPLSVRFQTTIFSTVTALPRSTSHHGLSAVAVWETDLPAKSPLVLPSMARLAGPSKAVLIWDALPFKATFSSPTKTCTSASCK